MPLDLEGLLGWSRDSRLEREREDRSRRERILARERELQAAPAERRNLQRLGGKSCAI